MTSFPWQPWVGGMLLCVSGLALLVLNSWWSPATRRTGKTAHWLIGFLVNGAGMSVIAVGWLVLAALGPRVSAAWPIGVGFAVALAGIALYLAGARRVGRLHTPSRYRNDLDTGGLYAIVRHPQALALTLIVVGLGGVSRSVPYLAAMPLLVLGWYVYARLEEKFELLPVFGARYEAYRRRTPAMFPSLSGLALLLERVASGRKTDDAHDTRG